MFSIDDYRRNLAQFPSDYWEDFNVFWKWKINLESKSSAHILDEDYRKEAYNRLCPLLSAWTTYRNGRNPFWHETLKDSLDKLSGTYNKLRNYSILDFESIPVEILEKTWHELGRVKEKGGNSNKNGYYYIISITKPLLLIWGQTPALDSHVRTNIPLRYYIPRYDCRWKMDEWIKVMEELGKDLNENKSLLRFIDQETEKMFGNGATIPYGRFLDIFYWVGTKCPRKNK
jgi:hypothetical protein